MATRGLIGGPPEWAAGEPLAAQPPTPTKPEAARTVTPPRRGNNVSRIRACPRFRPRTRERDGADDGEYAPRQRVNGRGESAGAALEPPVRYIYSRLIRVVNATITTKTTTTIVIITLTAAAAMDNNNNNIHIKLRGRIQKRKTVYIVNIYMYDVLYI